jgi:hypothetical protein
MKQLEEENEGLRMAMNNIVSAAERVDSAYLFFKYATFGTYTTIFNQNMNRLTP